MHQVVSRQLQFALMAQLKQPKIAQVFDAPMDVILEPTTVVQPDLIVIANTRRHIVTARAIEGVPNVIVEILSPSSMDRDTYIKRKLYERCGVDEYWIVDPEYGSLEVWRHDGQRYGNRGRFDRAGTLTSPDFPDMSIPLLPLFERA